MTTNAHNEWEGLEGFVDELRRLEAPERAHAAGDSRTPLPRSGARARVGWQVGIVITGLAAMALAYVVRSDSLARSESSTATTDSRADSAVTPAPSNDPRQMISALLSPWPAFAYAQSPGRAPAAQYPPLTALDPSRLRPGRRSYVRLSANAYHASVPHEAWTTILDTVRYRGAPAWRLVRRIDRTSNSGADASIVDTLWLRAGDLRPIARRVLAVPLLASAQTFTDTSMVKVDSVKLPPGAPPLPPAATSWTQRFAYRSNSPYVPSSDMLRLLLRATSLNVGWRASVQVATNQYNARPNPSGYVNLRVAGVDTVQLFNGRFPCWRVIIETAATPETWYVSQETGETLVTDGPFDTNYPESRSILLYGLEETTRVPPVRRR